jgi:hypothetical protein
MTRPKRKGLHNPGGDPCSVSAHASQKSRRQLTLAGRNVCVTVLASKIICAFFKSEFHLDCQATCGAWHVPSRNFNRMLWHRGTRHEHLCECAYYDDAPAIGERITQFCLFFFFVFLVFVFVVDVILPASIF